MQLLVRLVDSIYLRSRRERIPVVELFFHSHSLQHWHHLLVPHLRLVMGLEYTLQVLREVLEIAVHILQVQVVQGVDRERHTPEPTDFCHILQVHQDRHTGQVVRSAGNCCHNQEAVLLGLQPSSCRRRRLLPSSAPLACLLFRSHLSRAYWVHLFHILEAGIHLDLSHRENLEMDPSHHPHRDLSSLVVQIQSGCIPQEALVQMHLRVAEVCRIHLVRHIHRLEVHRVDSRLVCLLVPLGQAHYTYRLQHHHSPVLGYQVRLAASCSTESAG